MMHQPSASQSQVIGILGGGQLARMLCMAAARLGHGTVVLDPDALAPAAQVASAFLHAPYHDPDALVKLVSMADVVTYEFENVPVETASALAERVPVLPGPLALAKAQDRLVEKRFLGSLGIPTASHVAVDHVGELDDAVQRLGGSAVIKTRRFGYDGKGQARVTGPLDPGAAEAVFRSLGVDPALTGAGTAGALIVEAMVAFEGEMSVIGARDLHGTVRCFPPARNVHRDGILSTSSVPSGWGSVVEAAAVAHTTTLLHALEYVGVLGLEFFVLPAGSGTPEVEGPSDRLVANEFAPRVHNSGHWSEVACVVSQFEQHVRAVTGAPIVDPGFHSPCEMFNLIGEEVGLVPDLLSQERTSVHLYGKAEVRPGRKMGHATRLS